MRSRWVGDRRDRLKWPASALIAQMLKLASILHVAYFREDGHLVLDETPWGPVTVPGPVADHFGSLSAQGNGLAAVLGLTIAVHVAPFDPRNRADYRKGVLAAIAQAPSPRLVLMDPDTGFGGGPPHADTIDLQTVWAALSPGDALALYQHAARKANWCATRIAEVSQALGGVAVHAIRGQAIAGDVAILFAQKP